MTLAKGSCNKNSHFLRFRRFRRFRGLQSSVGYFSITMFKILDTEVMSDLVPLFKVSVLINAVKNTASSQSSTNWFLQQIKVKI